jgi:hypothetical protein
MQQKDNLPTALPKKLLDSLEKVNSFTDIARSDSKALVTITKELGKLETISMIIRIIADLNGYFNVSNKMNPLQIKDTAMLLLDRYYYLTLSDMILFSKYVKSGYFSDAYRLDGVVIMKWISQYVEMRNSEMENISIKENENIKEEERGIKAKPVMHMDKIIKKL